MESILERLHKLLAYDAGNVLMFNSGLFLVLFVLFLIVFNCLHRFPRAKMVAVILFSLYFYYKSSAECVFILLGVCVFDFFLGRILQKLEQPVWRRLTVTLNVLVNVGMLVWFKYINLIFDAIASVFSTRFEPYDVLLPAGISFFTFRSISYIVDIYRRQMPACKSFLDYLFFLTFFPPLLAGPVVRAKDMLPQIAARPVPTREMIGEGIFFIMSGLLKKVVIADYISANFVDRIFDNPMLYSGFENLMGCIGFTLQLYCDFSGYSDMAIGLALILGFRFKANFAAPFKAQSPTEFWHRWHISLSTWLRDYIYIPLGGNRKGRFRAYLNQFLTMVIGGLWHGASWMYLIWGAFHGFLLAIHKMLRKIWRLPERMAGHPAIRAVNIFITFTLVVIGFTFFRADSMEKVGQIFDRIIHSFHPEIAGQFVAGYTLIVALMAIGLFTHLSPSSWTEGTKNGFIRLAAPMQAVILALVLFFVIQMRQTDLVPFIYLQY